MKLIAVNVQGEPQFLLSEWQLVLVSPVITEISVTLVISIANLTHVDRVLSGKGGECSSFWVEVIRGNVALENSRYLLIINDVVSGILHSPPTTPVCRAIYVTFSCEIPSSGHSYSPCDRLRRCRLACKSP